MGETKPLDEDSQTNEQKSAEHVDPGKGDKEESRKRTISRTRSDPDKLGNEATQEVKSDVKVAEKPSKKLRENIEQQHTEVCEKEVPQAKTSYEGMKTTSSDDDSMSETFGFAKAVSPRKKDLDAPELVISDSEASQMSIQEYQRSYRSSSSMSNSREGSPVFLHKVQEQQRVMDKVLDTVRGRKIHAEMQANALYFLEIKKKHMPNVDVTELNPIQLKDHYTLLAYKEMEYQDNQRKHYLSTKIQLSKEEMLSKIHKVWTEDLTSGMLLVDFHGRRTEVRQVQHVILETTNYFVKETPLYPTTIKGREEECTLNALSFIITDKPLLADFTRTADQLDIGSYKDLEGIIFEVRSEIHAMHPNWLSDEVTSTKTSRPTSPSTNVTSAGDKKTQPVSVARVSSTTSSEGSPLKFKHVPISATKHEDTADSSTHFDEEQEAAHASFQVYLEEHMFNLSSTFFTPGSDEPNLTSDPLANTSQIHTQESDKDAAKETEQVPEIQVPSDTEGQQSKAQTPTTISKRKTEPKKYASPRKRLSSINEADEETLLASDAQPFMGKEIGTSEQEQEQTVSQEERKVPKLTDTVETTTKVAEAVAPQEKLPQPANPPTSQETKTASVATGSEKSMPASQTTEAVGETKHVPQTIEPSTGNVPDTSEPMDADVETIHFDAAYDEHIDFEAPYHEVREGEPISKEAKEGHQATETSKQATAEGHAEQLKEGEKPTRRLSSDPRFARAEPELIYDQLQPVAVDSIFVRARYGINNEIGEEIKPIPGEIYIFDRKNLLQPKEDMKRVNASDNYKWYNNGVRQRARHQSSHYFHIRDGESPVEGEKRAKEKHGFKKVTYINYTEPFVIVHYHGEKPASENKYENRGKSVPAHLDLRKNKETDLGDKGDMSDSEMQSAEEIFNFQERLKKRAAEDYQGGIRAAINPVRTDTKVFTEAIPYQTNCTADGQSLPSQVVEQIIMNTPIEHFLDARHHVITKPKSGDLYLFRADLPSKVPWNKHLHADGYMWKSNHYSRPTNYHFSSRKDYLRAPKEPGQPTVVISTFRRYTYDNNSNKKIVIYYTGNDEDLVRAPHGNAKHDRPFIPTSAQVQAAFAEAKDVGTQEYLKSQRATMQAGILGAITAPRDQQQLFYERRKKQAEYRLHGTELENASTLCKHYGQKFVKQAIHEPNIAYTLVDDTMILTLANATKLRTSNQPPMVFHYDTTFNTGEYYVSTLSFRNDLLEHVQESRREKNPSPIIPVGFLVHQTRQKENHEQFFSNVTKAMEKVTKGEFEATPKVLVTDQEFKTGIWGPTPVVHCWRHIIGDVGYHLQKRQHSIEDQNMAKRNIRTLLMTRTPQQYEKQVLDYLAKQEGPWRHKEFRNYFNTKTSPVIQRSAAYWNLKNLNMDHIENGMTNNAAEGANSALKAWTSTMNRVTEGKLGKKKRIELYETIAAAKCYSDNESAKILMAHYNRSPEYRFKKEYKGLLLKPEDMPKIRQMDIVEDIRYLNGIMQSNKNDDDETLAKDEKEKLLRERSKGLKFAAEDLARTSLAFQETSKGMYYCMDRNKEPYFLDVKANKCSCLSPGWCVHLIAARKMAGITDDFEVPSQPARSRRIPAPKHPSQKRRESASSKRPKPWDLDTKPKGTRDEQEEMVMEGLFDDQSADQKERAKQMASMRKAKEEAAELATQFSFMNKNKVRFDLNDHEYERNRAINEAKANPPRAKSPTPAQKEEIRKMELLSANYIDRAQEKYKDAHFDKDNFDRLSKRYTVGSRDSFFSGEKEYGFYVPAKDYIVMTAKEFDPKAAIYAARSIQHMQTFGQRRVGFLKSEQPNQDFLTMDKKILDNKDVTWNTMVTVCDCREPIFEDQLDKLRECSDCGEHFHFKCLPANVPREKEEKWDCGLCTVPTEGLAWGEGGIRNTCTMDNVMTSLTVKCMENKAFETKLKRFRYPSDMAYRDNKVSKAMQDTINAIKNGQSAKAHNTWNQLRISRDPVPDIKKINDMHGTPNRMVYSHIEEGTTVQRITSCDNCAYVEKVDKSVDIAPWTKNRLDREILKSVTEDEMSTKCPACRVGTCRKHAFSVDPKNPPFMIRYETEHNGTTLQEAMWAPKELDVQGGHTYELAHITLGKPNHFHGVITHKQQFLLYDGLRKPQMRHIDETLKNVVCSENNVIDVCYTWKEKTPAGKTLNAEKDSNNPSIDSSDSSDSDFVQKKGQHKQETTSTKSTEEAAAKTKEDNEKPGPSQEHKQRTRQTTSAMHIVHSETPRNETITSDPDYVPCSTLTHSDSSDMEDFAPIKEKKTTRTNKTTSKKGSQSTENTKENVATANVRTSTPTHDLSANDFLPSPNLSPNRGKVIKPTRTEDKPRSQQPEETTGTRKSTSSQQRKATLVNYSQSDDSMGEEENLSTKQPQHITRESTHHQAGPSNQAAKQAPATSQSSSGRPKRYVAQRDQTSTKQTAAQQTSSKPKTRKPKEQTKQSRAYHHKQVPMTDEQKKRTDEALKQEPHQNLSEEALKKIQQYNIWLASIGK